MYKIPHKLKRISGLKLEKWVKLPEEEHLKWTVLSDIRANYVSKLNIC